MVQRVDGTVAEHSARVKREVITLIVLVLTVDGIFIAGYFAANLAHASDMVKVIYTGVWTVITMIVVLRGLARIRSLRGGGRAA